VAAVLYATNKRGTILGISSTLDCCCSRPKNSKAISPNIVDDLGVGSALNVLMKSTIMMQIL